MGVVKYINTDYRCVYIMIDYVWIRLAVTNPVTTSSLNLSTVFRNLMVGQNQVDWCVGGLCLTGFQTAIWLRQLSPVTRELQTG